MFRSNDIQLYSDEAAKDRSMNYNPTERIQEEVRPVARFSSWEPKVLSLVADKTEDNYHCWVVWL
jgi:hypothetical protein